MGSKVPRGSGKKNLGGREMAKKRLKEVKQSRTKEGGKEKLKEWGS